MEVIKVDFLLYKYIGKSG